MKTIVLVVSKERTASQTVYTGLRDAIGGCVLHGHYLDAGHLDDALPANAKKIAKARHVEEALALAERRVFVTIVRDLCDRMVSGMWFLNHSALTDWRTQRGRFDGAEAIFADKLRTALKTDDAYYRHVYSRIGLPPAPVPGHYAKDEDQVYVLDFADLSQGFERMSLAVAGQVLELPRKNSGEQIGGALYGEYRRWSAPIIARMIEEQRAG